MAVSNWHRPATATLIPERIKYLGIGHDHHNGTQCLLDPDRIGVMSENVRQASIDRRGFNQIASDDVNAVIKEPRLHLPMRANPDEAVFVLKCVNVMVACFNGGQ